MSELQQLHRSGILTGSLNCYCLPCDRFIENSRKAYCHIACTEHLGNLNKIPYLPRFEGHHIRKFKTGYFCEFCNELIPTGVRVDLHVTKDEHNQNRGAHYLKSSRHGVSAFDNIHIDDSAWQGLLENLCCVCDIEIEDEATHKMDNGHLVNLIQKPIKFGKNDDIYRQINNLLIQCLTCNKLIPLNAMDEHFVTAEHVNLKSNCKVKANQGIKNTRKQDTNNIDSNYRTDTTAINDSRVKNTYENSSNIEDLELSKSLLHAAIYHDFGFNDDIESFFHRNSETDFKSSHDIRKHNIEKRSSTVPSTLTDEQVNFNSKYKIQENHDNQDTFKQDTNSNNINAIDITTLNDSGNKYEHDNSSNIEEFEKYQTELHAAIYRSLDIDDETETLFGENSEIVINHDPDDIKKYENINQSTSTDVQYPAEQVDPNSNCKVEANLEIQNTLKQNTNSNNNDKIDATALNDSSSKYEQDNSFNMEEFEISKTMLHTAIRNSIDGNDETKNMFCNSSENVFQHDYNDFEKHEKINQSMSSNVQYQAEYVDFNSKGKMEANHDLKQDSNSKNIVETNTTAPNNSGGKKEHDNSTNIDEILLHAAMYHGINLNDDIKTVFSKSSEIDIVPSTSTDEQVNFNSKNKMEENHEIKDTLKQDTNSKNINKIDITTLYDSGNKYEYDNSSNVEEFEKYQSMIHKAINRSLDIDDETEALFGRHSDIDIKHDHDDIKRHIDSINVQNPAENVDLNSKCQVELNLEVQDSYKKDINRDNNKEIDTIALNVSGYKIDNENSSNVDELVISKTMLHAEINDETEIEFCRSSEIEIKHEHDDIKKHIEKHENIESSSASTDVQCPVEHVDLNSKCKVEVNYEIQDTLKQDSNSKNVNKTDITALNDSGNKIEHANSSNIEKLEMSKTMLHESININAETETVFCKSSEIDVKRDYDDIKKHIENHENIEQSTSTDIQYPPEQVDLYSKIKVALNFEIRGTLKQGTNSNDKNKADTAALDDCNSDDEYLTTFDKFPVSKTMLQALLYQCIDINEETEKVFCRVCKTDVSLERNDIMRHIEKHANIGQSTSTDVQYPENFKFDAKEWLDLKFDDNYYTDNNVKKDVTANSITEDSCLQIPKDNSNNLRANTEANIYTNLRQFAKDNYFTYHFEEVDCRICKVRLPFAVKSMHEHVNSENHKRNVEAARAASANTNGDTCLTKEPVINTLNSLQYVEQKYLATGYLINKKHFISTESFLLFAKHDDESLICMNCGSIFQKEPMLYLEEHAVICSLPMNAILRLVTSEEEEFIREIKPEIFHCGMCHMIFSGWDQMQVHLRSSVHETAKHPAHLRLMYVLSLVFTKPYPENFKVWDELERLRDLCDGYQQTL